MTLTKDNPHRKERKSITLSTDLIIYIDSIKGEGSFSKALEKVLRRGKSYM